MHGRRKLLDVLSDLRNRIFASPRFQNAAAAIPGVRRIADRRAAQLFDLTAGFVYSQILYALVELDWFERLRDGPAPVPALAEEGQLSREATLRLAKAAAALGLVELRSGDRVALGGQGAALLGNPSVFEMVRHHRILFEDLSDPVGLLRAPKGQSRLARYWGYAREAEDARELGRGLTSSYSSLMAATQGFIARDILAAHRIDGYRHILDVGGGEGAFLIEAARQARQASLTLFDLPSVAAVAEERFGAAGLETRARAVGGSFKTDPLPGGADLLTLVRVLHDHDRDVAEGLLKKAFDALEPGGTLLVAEPMAATAGAAAMGDAYFGIYLWAMGTGEPRSRTELRRMIEGAGFSRVRPVATRRPMLMQLILAEKRAVTTNLREHVLPD
jgi:demethylspheroidene O-methyltransferase